MIEGNLITDYFDLQSKFAHFLPNVERRLPLKTAMLPDFIVCEFLLLSLLAKVFARVFV